jgi:predicted RNase H-like nuclease (RuvC/YqgF family)
VSAFAQDVKPVKPPEVFYPSKTDKEFEKKLEELKKEVKLLELKAKISELKKKIEKAEGSPSQAQPRPQLEKLLRERDEETSYKRQLLEYQMRQRELQRIERELKLLQGLFTGIFEVNGKKVVFDKYGRKYTEGSMALGMRIVEIQDDGITVEDRTGEVFKIPLSSAMEEKKTMTSFTGPEVSPPQETPPQEVPPPTLQEEVPPPPLGE